MDHPWDVPMQREFSKWLWEAVDEWGPGSVDVTSPEEAVFERFLPIVAGDPYHAGNAIYLAMFGAPPSDGTAFIDSDRVLSALAGLVALRQSGIDPSAFLHQAGTQERQLWQTAERKGNRQTISWSALVEFLRREGPAGLLAPSVVSQLRYEHDRQRKAIRRSRRLRDALEALNPAVGSAWHRTALMADLKQIASSLRAGGLPDSLFDWTNPRSGARTRDKKKISRLLSLAKGRVKKPPRGHYPWLQLALACCMEFMGDKTTDPAKEIERLRRQKRRRAKNRRTTISNRPRVRPPR